MRGIIVAAGEGRRMRPITYWKPKPLVPVGGKPLILHIIEGFVAAGVQDIVVVIGHLREKMRQALGDGSNWGACLEYAVQEEPLGTGHAVLLARDLLGEEPFLLSWGDILVPPSHYQHVLTAARETGADGVLSVNWVEDPWEGAAVYIEEGLVTRIIEKPERGTSTTHFNNAGILVLPPRVLELTAALKPSARGEIELPQAVGDFLAEGGRLRAVEVEGYWSDVARPGTALTMNGAVLLEAHGEEASIDPSADVSDGAKLIPPVCIGPGASVASGCVLGPNVTVMSGASVAGGSVLDNTVLDEGAQVTEDCRLSWVFVGDHARLPANTHLTALREAAAVLPPGA